MSAFLQRLADRVRTIGRHPAVGSLYRVLRRFLDHPVWRRIGCAVVSRLPAGPADRVRVLYDRHPDLFRLVSGCVALVVLAMVWVSYDYVRVKNPGDRALPDFRVIKDTDDRKRAFIEFLLPVVQYENARVLRQREKVLDILDDLEDGDEVAAHEHAWLAEMADRYRVKAENDLGRARSLSTRVDVVPDSLAVAQAALESAWGTSRFARQGNNLFGQWCFTAGCGIVPLRRPEQSTYEVQAFDTIAESVRTYLRNLNSHPAYQLLRDIRAEARREGREPTGRELAAGLIKYAAIGEQYVHHIRGVIRRNNLEQLALAN